MGLMDDSILSHRARQNELAARQMQQITEHNGVQELWWDVSFSVAGVSDIPLPWKGVSREDVQASFKEWLASAEKVGGIPWLTIKVEVDGSPSELTFRPDWVAGFQVGERGRPRA